MLVKARFMFGPMDGLEKNMKKPLDMLLWIPVEIPIGQVDAAIKDFSHKATQYELVFHDDESAIYRWKP